MKKDLIVGFWIGIHFCVCEQVIIYLINTIVQKEALKTSRCLTSVSPA